MNSVRDQVIGDVIPISREELITEWREDPIAVVEQAEECGLELEAYLNVRAPASKEHPGPVVEQLLENIGIRMKDTERGKVDSTLVSRLPQLRPDKSTPESMLVAAFLDQRYNDVLLDGKRALNSLTGLQSSTIWREYYEEAPIRVPQIAPAFDFRNIIGRFRRTNEDLYRINKLTNETSENRMVPTAEGARPPIVKLERSTDQIGLLNDRIGLEASDSFLKGSDVRANDIVDAVDRIALDHRIVILRRAAKLVTDKTPAANNVLANAQGNGGNVNGIAHTAGMVQYPHFLDFISSFGTAYRGNCIIGNRQSINSLKLMSLSAGQNITFGSVVSFLPNSNFVDFNADMMDLGFGWIDNDSETGFVANKFWAFQRETTLVFVQRMGMDQDEMERDAGRQIMRRWFGTSSNFGIMDTTGMKSYDFNA